MNKSEKLIKNTAILAGGTICSKILGFIVIPFFSRWLSVEDFGLFDLYGTYVTLLIPVLTFSCGEAVFRFLLDTNDPREKRKIVSSSLFIVVPGVLIGSVMLPLIVQKNTEVKLTVTLFMIAELLNNYLLFYIRGEKKLALYAIANIVTMFFELLFVFLFVYKFHMALTGILLGYGCAYATSDFFIVLLSPYFHIISIKEADKAFAKKMLWYSFPLIPNTICLWIMNVSNRTIIDWILGPSLLGIYAIACKIPSLCSTLFGVFQLSWQQSISESIYEEDRDIFCNKVLNNLICTTISIAIGILSVNFIMFGWVFDQKYSSGYWQSGILIPATVLASISAYFGGIFIGQKDSKSNGMTTMYAAAANIVSHLVLIRFIGIYAASVSTLIGFALLVILRWIKVNKDIKLSITKRTWGVLLLFFYYIAIQYFRFKYLEYVNLLLAIILFVVINYHFVSAILGKVLNRIKLSTSFF